MTRFLLGYALATVLLGCGDDETGAVTSTGGGGAGGEGGQGGGSELLVDTAYGPVQGTVIGDTRAFLGIPFAAPPVGARRWLPPTPPEPWTEPLDASAHGPPCAQPNVVTGSFDPNSEEDCLTINVWTPSPAPSAPLPVMLWIYGGGFFTGGSGLYPGEAFVPGANVVLVTFNYRLGALGFLAHPDLTAEDSRQTSGNNGFEDQRFAMEWVRDNVTAFGGDPGNVTIFGESAGGISVCNHLVAPDSAGLFDAAIIESGPCDLLVRTLADGEAQGVQLAQAVGCSGAGALDCLRASDTQTLVNVFSGLPNVVDLTGASWGPQVDGVILPTFAEQALAAGNFTQVPTIVGSNRDEGTLFVWAQMQLGIDATQYAALMPAVAAGHGSDAATLLAEYPSSDYATPGLALSALLSEAIFNCASRRTVRALSAAGADAWLYHFERAPTSSLNPELGAFHGAEIAYLYGIPVFGFTPTASDEPLSEAMRGYWGRFASAHDPSGGGAVDWPAYATASDQHLTLDLNAIADGSGLRAQKCDFWDAVP